MLKITSAHLMLPTRCSTTPAIQNETMMATESPSLVRDMVQNVIHEESCKAQRACEANGCTSEGAFSKHMDSTVLKAPDNWYYPLDIANDLQGVALPSPVKHEIFATAFEYTRCVIPSYVSWDRYVGFMRIFIMGIIAEFKGELVNVAAGDDVLGYSLSHVLSSVFAGMPGHDDMAREFRTFLLVTAEKTSGKRNGELFRRYVNSLAQSPAQWFRIRDTDALCRFTIAAALACNEVYDVWFSEAQFQVLSELGDIMYDAVSFYKHRSEGETNSSFAYFPSDMSNRQAVYRKARELLWALDVAWAPDRRMAHVTNFIRPFGGPIHMMMRRYRFVEENLTIGQPEDASVIEQTRNNFKLWNRVDADDHVSQKSSAEDVTRYQNLLSRSDFLMFDGLAQFLEKPEADFCKACKFRHSYGAQRPHQFGGAMICEDCKHHIWQPYLDSMEQRALAAFPELEPVLYRDVRNGVNAL
ncbi:Alpha-ionylideneethane synthase aba3 [Pseudocercospora fuligena]|uniref:Alpha-ionylideneethane synthase aba3 n=1 Tax=Pseudocercospora fuligena TaxID=685502 RepID=A0A8H6RPV1_9PEZI|nr:Alpha-ionylideneethane synthase aba3 [Pseudocercospora fuligena]